MVKEISSLMTEQINENTKEIDKKNTNEILKLINNEDKKVAFAVEKELPDVAKVIDEVVAAFKKGGRLIYVGAGTSGRIAILDAAECPPTFGTDPDMVAGIIAGGEVALTKAIEGIEDKKDEAILQLGKMNLKSEDAVIGVAASGRTPFVVEALKHAKSIGCYTAGISCTNNSIIGEIASDKIEVKVGAEVISGSTRLKAGTAQKMVLNMISTTSMILMGKVYGNLMVDVQPTNEKLLERAKRIVVSATGVSYQKAEEVLTISGFSTKIAIVMIKGGYSKEDAMKLLNESDGFIHKALNL